MSAGTPLPLLSPPPTTTSSADEQAPPPAPPTFVQSLFDILRREDPNIIRWTADGRAFEILDQRLLATRILPRYFRHSKYASFQRQLNYFGFRKWAKQRAAICTYSQLYFGRDRPGDLHHIKRRVKASDHPVEVMPMMASLPPLVARVAVPARPLLPPPPSPTIMTPLRSPVVVAPMLELEFPPSTMSLGDLVKAEPWSDEVKPDWLGPFGWLDDGDDHGNRMFI
ncbi:Aste57867_12382 [Aphanomyces stellatus]|uniref:Aste57867_12382 protein n=1 Tax=Aphanomyces stellatus TaxID=120398 RepID=A0A485KW73_9STRA|nr:hypothetical protein As57867_012336 [Aphanomyces stellatus]VFT89233.1 Aste57867_12382 [Aphanomyces stellatus]